METNECIALILAGGKGSRLGALTNHMAKPAVYFGGKYRIIDFTLSNCVHSHINPVGVLTQYYPFTLHDYISDGHPWEYRNINDPVSLLPSSRCGCTYTGTANAVYHNFDFIEKFNPKHVLILSGDHIYKMDYTKMLDYHIRTDADITISAIPVPLSEASRFGIINASEDGRIIGFEEKPIHPKSNLASMGIYLFKWDRLKHYLNSDESDICSDHDFGKNIIPTALSKKEKLSAYRFDGYWKDVGTVQCFWKSNMDLLEDIPPIDLYDESWKILTHSQSRAPCYLSAGAEVTRSIIAEGCHVYGKLSNSVLYDSVTVEEGAKVINSVLLPNSIVKKGARIFRSVIGDHAHIGENTEIGTDHGVSTFVDDTICSDDVSLVGPGVYIDRDTKIVKNSHVDRSVIRQRFPVSSTYAYDGKIRNYL